MQAAGSFALPSGIVARVGLALGPLLFLLFAYVLDIDPERPAPGAMAGVALWMAVWWITEAVPLAATALLPLVLFPVAGVASTREIAPAYTNSIIFLFIGGILIALAMERWRLHRRIALFLISLFGSRPAGLLAGFMTASAFLSMWISNTATAVMMLPIGLAIIARLEEQMEENAVAGLRLALLLGIAYSCSVGGMTTPIGTPPNMAFLRIYEIQFPDAAKIAFGQWILFTAPLTLTIQLAIWIFLWGVIMRFARGQAFEAGVIRRERSELGKMSREEWLVAIVFALAGVLWTFRRGLVIREIGLSIPGWSSLVPFGKSIDDGWVAMFCAALLFVLPGRRADDRSAGDAKDAGKPGRAGGRLLDAHAFRQIPWGIILLFGGGFALAKGFGMSGLSETLSTLFAGLGEIPDWALVLLVCLAVSFLTELTSNTALTQVVLPVFAALASARGLPPLLIMIPATLSASCAFMMPVATPPNAIVFGSEKIKIGEMARTGVALNVIGAVIITIFVLVFGGSLTG